jgi:molecular chaperone DnaK (HSP70)
MESIKVFNMNDEQFDQRDKEHHKEIQRLKNKHHFAIRKLKENLKIAVDALIDKTEYSVNQWQKAWSPEKETIAQKAIKDARQALEKIKG